MGEEIKYNKTRIDEIGLLFNLPGYPEIELIENGLETLLTVKNIEEYVSGIFDKLFGSGISDIINCFKYGFNLVFDINSLKCFYSREIVDSICGSLEDKWDADVIIDNIKAEHGYDKNSAIFKYLIQFMTEINKKDKKQFLLFVTGSPRLPVGGNYKILLTFLRF